MPATDTPARLRLLNGTAYLLFTTSRPFAFARATCARLGAVMASVPSAEVEALVAEVGWGSDS